MFQRAARKRCPLLPTIPEHSPLMTLPLMASAVPAEGRAEMVPSRPDSPSRRCPAAVAAAEARPRLLGPAAAAAAAAVVPAVAPFVCRLLLCRTMRGAGWWGRPPEAVAPTLQPGVSPDSSISASCRAARDTRKSGSGHRSHLNALLGSSAQGRPPPPSPSMLPYPPTLSRASPRRLS